MPVGEPIGSGIFRKHTWKRFCLWSSKTETTCIHLPTFVRNLTYIHKTLIKTSPHKVDKGLKKIRGTCRDYIIRDFIGLMRLQWMVEAEGDMGSGVCQQLSLSSWRAE